MTLFRHAFLRCLFGRIITQTGLRGFESLTDRLFFLESYTVTDFIKTPARERKNITRSRGVKARDAHFSVENNSEIVNFCRSVGARRHEVMALRAGDLKYDKGNYYVKIKRGKIGIVLKTRRGVDLPASRSSLVTNSLFSAFCFPFLDLRFSIWFVLLEIEIRIVEINDKSEPFANRLRVRICTVWCG